MARPRSAPEWASRSSTFVDWVEESTPATVGTVPPPSGPCAQRTPSNSSVTSWSSRSFP